MKEETLTNVVTPAPGLRERQVIHQSRSLSKKKEKVHNRWPAYKVARWNLLSGAPPSIFASSIGTTRAWVFPLFYASRPRFKKKKIPRPGTAIDHDWHLDFRKHRPPPPQKIHVFFFTSILGILTTQPPTLSSAWPFIFIFCVGPLSGNRAVTEGYKAVGAATGACIDSGRRGAHSSIPPSPSSIKAGALGSLRTEQDKVRDFKMHLLEQFGTTL